jgi:2-alkyl-3-oxoalkanoate reductase
MRILIAGATGAIGRPLIVALEKAGHTVTGMTHSERGQQFLREQGAECVFADALDESAVRSAVERIRPEMIIDELTSLPQNPVDMPKAAARDRQLRLEGGQYLYAAAQAAGVRRYLVQSSGFFAAPGQGLADETAGFAVEASPGVAAASQTYQQIENRILSPSPMEGVALRYGFFYGPGTRYNPDGGAAEQMRNRERPIVGNGEGVWSFIHIEDAAIGTVAALEASPGIYNIVDDHPSELKIWLPAFAKWVNAPPPAQISEEAAIQSAGPDAVY